jgi:peptidoglycan hydrolase-like protein with peptidoglycan-binding domain
VGINKRQQLVHKCHLKCCILPVMRRTALLLISLSFFALSYGSATAQAIATSPFISNLSLGSSGLQVFELQQVLNQNPATLIASVGPGSPGNETTYFGGLTEAAVIRFQEKYASQILTPAGLTQATGFVGLYSRNMLNELYLIALGNAGGSATSPVIPPASTTAPQNPNAQNLGAFLSAIDALAAQQGVSSSELALIHQQIMDEVATTTNLRAEFLQTAGIQMNQTSENNSSLSEFAAAIGNVFSNLVTPTLAYAASGNPFGGALYYSFFCDESDTWLLAVEPLPPSSPALLTYEPLSEAFSSYNIPETSSLLGFYTPGAGECLVGACPYCYQIPNDGMITAQVGSSPN